MIKKFVLSIISISILFLSGCSASKQIDFASIAQAVTVDYKSNSYIYSFYIIGNSDKVNSVSIKAESLEQACELAKQSYIPDLSLAKLELFAVNKNLYQNVLKKDISYMSTKYYMSPTIYVTLIDGRTIDLLSKSVDETEKIIKRITLLKSKNENLKTNSLLIFNNLSTKEQGEFYISYINSNKELKAEAVKIKLEK